MLFNHLYIFTFCCQYIQQLLLNLGSVQPRSKLKWFFGGKNAMVGKVLCEGLKAKRTESCAKLILCNAHSSSPFPWFASIFHWLSRWSTCPLAFDSWLSDHVIYLNLTTIFTQNDNLGPFWVKIVVVLWI